MNKKILISFLFLVFAANIAPSALFASGALSDANAAIANPKGVFDGAKNASSLTTKGAPVAHQGQQGETQKPTLGENIRNYVKKNKSRIISSGAAALAGYFVFGGPVGALIGFGLMYLFIGFLRL